MSANSPEPTGRSGGLIGRRGRTIMQSGAWSLIAKVCAAANLFVSIPFVLHALGPAQFGAWATLVSFVAFAGFLDFGFGNGTMNLVAAAHGRDLTHQVAGILHEGMRALIRIAVVLAVIVVVAIPAVPWQQLLGLPDEMAASSRAAAAGVLATIVIGVPLNLATRAQLGLGRGDRAFRWQAGGQLLTLAVVILAARAGASLPWLTAAAVATPLVAAIGNTAGLWRDPALRVHESHAARDPEIGRRIRREGLMFFVLQLAAALAFSADLPLISSLRGPTEAGTYAVVQRLFSMIPLGLSLVWVPLWPIYRQALAAGDQAWVVRTLKRSLFLAVAVAAVTALALTLGFERIVGFWVKQPLAVHGALLGGFALWCVVDAAGTAIATFLNAASVMRLQLFIAVTFALVCVISKVVLLNSIGIAALPWATSLIYLVICIVPFSLLLPDIIRGLLSRSY